MARKRLNKHVVIGLSLFGFLMMIVASVLMLQRLQARDPKYYAELAEQFAADGDFRNAAVFYGRAWERSKDGRYLVLQGKTLLEDGEVARAIATWGVVLTQDPGLVEAHRQRLTVLLELADLYGSRGDWSAVERAADDFLRSVDPLDPKDAAFVHHARGLALAHLNRRDADKLAEAEQELRQAMDLQPQEVDYAVDYAEHLGVMERDEEAESLLKKLLDRFPPPGAEAVSARVALGEFYGRRQRWDDARAALEEAINAAGDEADALRDARLAYARFLTSRWIAERNRDEAKAQPLFDQAETLLRQTIEADPDEYEPYLYLATLYKAARRFEDVVKVCAERLDRGLSRRGLQAARNRLHAFMLMILAGESSTALGAMAIERGDDAKRQAYLAEAQRFLDRAAGEYPNHPALFAQLARLKLARGEDRAALEDLRRADERYRSMGTIEWDTKILLARVHLRLGEPGAAREVLEDVMDEARRDRARDARFWTLYARALLETNDLTRALNISDQVLAADPDNAEALSVRAAVYQRQGRGAEAARLAERIVQDPVGRIILKARQHSLQGETDTAVRVLRQGLKDHPTDGRLVGALARTLSAAGREEEARRVVEEALKARPDDLGLKRLAVSTDPNLSEAEREEALLEVIRAEPDGYARALELAGHAWRKGDTKAALESLDEALRHLVGKDTPLARQVPIDQHAVVLKARMALAASLSDEAERERILRESRDQAVRFNVDGAGGQSIVGLYHLYRREYEPAATAFRRVLESQPTNAFVLAKLGQCLQLSGDRDEARRQYERAVAANPNEAEAYKGLAALAKQEDDAEAFERYLSRCEELIPDDPWVRRMVLERKEEADPQSAIARRERMRQEHPDDADNLRKLADLYEKTGRLDRADECYEAFARLRPDDDRAALTVAAYYRRTDRPEKALSFLRAYAESRPTPEAKANARILLADHRIKVGDPQAAERELLTAADTASTFEVARSLAELYLKVLDDPRRALEWTDRALAMLKDARDRRAVPLLHMRIACQLDRRVNALDRVGESLDRLRADFPDDPTRHLLEARWLARKGEVERAVAALTDYLAKRPDDPEGLYLRALHRCSLGRLGAAIEDLQTLKRFHPLALDLKPRLLLARLLRQLGKSGERVRELEALVRDAPDSYLAANTLAQAYLDTGRADLAEQLATARINRTGDSPDARWYALRGRVRLARGRAEEALADFHRAASISGYAPSEVLRVLDAYLQLKRYEEGLSYYTQHVADAESAPPVLFSRKGRLLAAAGRDREAVKVFRDAMRRAMRGSEADVQQVTGDLLRAFPPDRGIELFAGTPADERTARANDRILVRFYRQAGRAAEAVPLLKRLLTDPASDAERAVLLAELGDVQQDAGDYEEAHEAYKQSLRYNPDRWITLNNLAYLLSDRMGRHREALPYARRAVRLADDPNALDTLGWIYVGLGEHTKGIAELSRAVRLAPQAPLFYYHLGEAYRRDGQFDQAREVLENGADLVSAPTDPLAEAFQASLAKLDRQDRTP